jgi:hypothetical protein
MTHFWTFYKTIILAAPPAATREALDLFQGGGIAGKRAGLQEGI